MHGETIPLEKLESYGESTARSLGESGTVSGREVAAELRRALRSLARVHRELQRSPAGADEAARWLLDNWYLVQREALEAAAAFHRVSRLRAADRDALVAACAAALLSSGRGRADAQRCRAFLTGFQRKTVLNRRELGLFPAALRCAAVRALAELYGSRTPDAALAGALFTSLRLWGMMELTELLEAVDRTEQILREDPAGVYPLMDEGTRADYRRQVEKLAERRGIPEYRAAGRAVRMSRSAAAGPERHVGWWLFERPLGGVVRPRRGGGYIALNVLVTLFLALLAGFLTESAAAALLLALPLSQLVKEAADLAALRLCPPRRLPRMALDDGIPAEGRTICVVSVLLTGSREAEAAAARLEEFRLASRDCGENLLLGLLADLPAAEKPESEADRALLGCAAAAVEALNVRYGGGFYLLCRPRVWCADSGRYGAWERKRGAVMELARLLCGEKTTLRCEAGSLLGLRGTRYILTLDADTRLTPGTARELAGAMLHPLNRPVIDPRRGVVAAGHGVIQPRLAVDLRSAARCEFTRLFAPQGGSDPYAGGVGEVYSDLFDSGGFAGKGIFDARALLTCLDGRLPENLVLSHDALEGAFLRGGLMSDAELVDGFPAGPLSYYRRQHRWVRGDWQNAPWLFARGRALPPIERWRLFDSLRRSLVPAATLCALLAGLLFPTPAMQAVSLAALAAFFLPVLFPLARAALRPEEEVRVRLRAHVAHGTAGLLTAAFARLLLLPHEAWVNLSAALTALWRMLVTKRNRMQWQTAAQSDGGREGVGASLAAMPGALLTGLACLLFPTVLGKAAGVFWLLSPVSAAAMGRADRSRRALSAADRAWLKQRAAEIWRYFADFCTPEEHFLPPDNFQTSPPVGAAHRTSPTNIGLALVSALCALDLGVASRHEALGLVENLLATAERLPKWRGHLYNWYDTRTLRPLQPPYVSTVDSGNLAGCLLAVRQGLLEYGCPGLAARADALWTAMDFAPLYDRRRCLFRIGLEPGSAGEAGSWYDLLESEERLTGYIAIASGQAPVKHWRRLSRAQVGCDGFRGMASWSGTMFEYLMPELFLPLYRDSLLWESARFCLYVQKKSRFGPQRLWGKSESAFFSLDAALNYRYKAHGCAALALCRDRERERVVAPYASFLALAVEPPAALANLRRLEKAGALGPYGFWEAVDFTPSRCPGGQGVTVRCVMAHHLGMSMAAIANALLGGVCRRRFLCDPAMSAYTSLLQEKVPLGGLLLRRREFTPPVRPRPQAETAGERSGADVDFLRPAAQPLSNGLYNVMLTESGLSLAHCGGVLPYRRPHSPLGDGRGIALLLRTGGEVFSLLPEPGGAGGFSWSFPVGSALWRGSGHGLEWTVSAAVPREESGERRSVTLRAADGSVSGELFCLLEPCLAPDDDYVNHPSYSRLGLHAELRDGVLLWKRLPRGAAPALYMALACSADAEFSSDFHRFPGRGGFPASFAPNAGWQSAPFVSIRTAVEAGREPRETVFALCVAAGAEEAARGARRILGARVASAMAEGAGRLLELDGAAVRAALEMLPELLWPSVAPAARAADAMGRDALWRLGISGDLPIAAMELGDDGSLAAAAVQLRRHALLSACGVVYDLVFLTRDRGDYRRGSAAALEELLRKLDREALVGVKGGIHFADAEPGRAAVTANAAVLLDGSGGEPAHERLARADIIMSTDLRPAEGRPVYGWNADGSFTFTVRGAMPPRAWANVLTNGDLGALAADGGTGHVWYKNARECPLIPWSGDPLAVRGPETLEAEADGQRRSLFAEAGSGECRVTFSFGAAVWETQVGGAAVRLTAWVPPRGAARFWRIETDRPVKLFWCAPLQLAPERRDAPACRVSLDANGLFRCENPRCAYPGTTAGAVCSVPWERASTDRLAFLAGGDDKPERCGEPCFAAEFTVTERATLVFGVTPLPAASAPEEAQLWWRERVTRLTAETPDPALNHLLGGWCQYQALAGRILGRSSLYQSGGAIGFRDQLQDYVNLIPLDAAACRGHILVCCAHQYEEGDVQHWWHPGAAAPGKGVRTRCSDDLLWLVWALCEYVEATGDEGLCREGAPWLVSPPLGAEETTRYETPGLSGARGSVLEHCRAALELTLRRGTGAHALLLMGGGDWNDGLDGLGEGGESAWLTWFFALCARDFAALLERLGEPDAGRYRRAAASAAEAAGRTWDGDRWLRGYYGDGAPLGARESRGCRLDSVCQSFAALWDDTPPQRADAALDTALRELFDAERGLVKLCDPPFPPEGRSPGYVTGYGPGFRENGGQYTHAALFLARALFRRGRADDGWRVLRAAMAEGRDDAAYGAEPFVLAADLSANPDCPGRAGWSWYTGAAGWFLRVACGSLLGFRLRDGRAAEAEPCPPDGWRDFAVRWRDAGGAEHVSGLADGAKFTK